MDTRTSSAPHAFDHCHYVPCVRWKQGEYQALLRLFAETKDNITPLIEVPEIGWDFEKRVEAKTLDEHLAPFAKRVQEKWGNALCFIDLQLLEPNARLSGGTHPLYFVFKELRRYRCASVPVTGPERDDEYQQAVRRAASEDRRGVCLRLRLEQAARDDVKQTVDSLLRMLLAQPDNTDFVLDLGAPNFVPLEVFSGLLQSIIARIPYLARWRTFTMIGTSFPSTMGELVIGPQEVVRHEWRLYKHLVGALLQAGRRLPTFGDYTIAHPDVAPLDMRKVKPAASIRYTVEDAWYILKGPNVRDHGFAQYQDLCRLLTSARFFAGSGFSAGDDYIEGCANGTKTTGNLTTWRWVATNHHIQKVVADIASFHGSSSTP